MHSLCALVLNPYTVRVLGLTQDILFEGVGNDSGLQGTGISVVGLTHVVVGVVSTEFCFASLCFQGKRYTAGPGFRSPVCCYVCHLVNRSYCVMYVFQTVLYFILRH